MGGGIVCQDEEKCTFLVRAIQFAEHGSANYVRKERARMRNLAGSYPGPYLRLDALAAVKPRERRHRFRVVPSATMKSVSGAARSATLYRAFAGVQLFK